MPQAVSVGACVGAAGGLCVNATSGLCVGVAPTEACEPPSRPSESTRVALGLCRACVTSSQAHIHKRMPACALVLRGGAALAASHKPQTHTCLRTCLGGGAALAASHKPQTHTCLRTCPAERGSAGDQPKTTNTYLLARLSYRERRSWRLATRALSWGTCCRSCPP